jgi:hypothetical protein
MAKLLHGLPTLSYLNLDNVQLDDEGPFTELDDEARVKPMISQTSRSSRFGASLLILFSRTSTTSFIGVDKVLTPFAVDTPSIDQAASRR